MKHLLLTIIAAVVLVTTAFAGPIHDAARDGDLAGVQAELDKGADVNKKDNDGMTPLNYAAVFGEKEIVELLLANGADVNAKAKDGVTPLFDAVATVQKEIAKLLIINGADVNVADPFSMTPLHFAAVFGQKEITELLLAECADVDAKNLDDETPLDMAEMIVATSPGPPGFGGDFEETIDLLRKHQLPCFPPPLILVYRKDKLTINVPFDFRFTTKAGKSYTVEATGDLLKWNKVETIRGTGSEVKFTDIRKALFERQYYRVKVVE